MRTTRPTLALAALVALLALPAHATSPTATSQAATVSPADPQRALHAAGRALVADPSPATVERWQDARRAALLTGLTAAAAEEEAEPEFSAVYAAGDVDGDGRSEVAVVREDGTELRSGLDGRRLLRRDGGVLLPVRAAGPVRLLHVADVGAVTPAGFEVTTTTTALDALGRPVWAREDTGSVSFVNALLAYAVVVDHLPWTLLLDRVDDQGRPALLLGSLTAADSSAGTASQQELVSIALEDGTETALPPLVGVGTGLVSVVPVAPGCLATTEPVGPASRVALECADASWTAAVPLAAPYPELAGDFGGDRVGDLALTTFGFEEARPEEVQRGTHVLDRTDGSTLATSTVDDLYALGVDVSRDGQPDFLRSLFTDDGLEVRGTTLAGDVLYRRAVALRGSGFAESLVGTDITGDGVADGLLVVQPDRGISSSFVVDGRDGRVVTVKGVDGLVSPGLRPAGADLAVLDAVGGRLRVDVRSGHTGQPVLQSVLPGPTGTVGTGGTGAAELDRDGRRDLVLSHRSGDRRVLTAVSATGRVLWQQVEDAPLLVVEDVLVASAGARR